MSYGYYYYYSDIHRKFIQSKKNIYWVKEKHQKQSNSIFNVFSCFWALRGTSPSSAATKQVHCQNAESKPNGGHSDSSPSLCQPKPQSGKTGLQRGTMEGGWFFSTATWQSVYECVRHNCTLWWDVSRHFFGGNSAKPQGMLTVMPSD